MIGEKIEDEITLKYKKAYFLSSSNWRVSGLN